ncbi:TonB family protein [Paracoccus aminophilus]|uniref:TonB family protein n=1 Tax=Paracoccus aminophilus JCM 7686 TaxID=1367847 RepID=S5YA51_PARAH|nr:TonB family protein [Paracoccus aminophilus]AGT08283.1 TonB family protein [Paracoccus aminophilus JCM 7686]
MTRPHALLARMLAVALAIAPAAITTPAQAEPYAQLTPQAKDKADWKRQIQLRFQTQIRVRLRPLLSAADFGHNRVVTIGFSVATDGTISELHVAKSSGAAELDRKVLKAAGQMPKMPPAPVNATSETTTVSVEIAVP